MMKKLRQNRALSCPAQLKDVDLKRDKNWAQLLIDNKRAYSMKTILLFISCLSILVTHSPCSETHLLWYKAVSNYYNIYAYNPGPDLPYIEAKNLDEGKIITGTRAQYSGAISDGFSLGNGPNDNEGRCSFLWSQAINEMDIPGSNLIGAKIRGEYRNGYSGTTLCTEGPISLRIGVADFGNNLSYWGGTTSIPDTAYWKDSLNMLSYIMGLTSSDSALGAEENRILSIPSPMGLDGDFFELDVTPQVRWILEHNYYYYPPRQYAIVFLVQPISGSTGRVYLYGAENQIRPSPGSTNPWTADGNTMHLLLEVQGSMTTVYQDPSKTRSERMLSISPQPFQTSTRICYQILSREESELAVFSLDGRKIRVLTSGILSKGRYSATWDGRNQGNQSVPSGYYIIQLKSEKNISAVKVLLMR